METRVKQHEQDSHGSQCFASGNKESLFSLSHIVYHKQINPCSRFRWSNFILIWIRSGDFIRLGFIAVKPLMPWLCIEIVRLDLRPSAVLSFSFYLLSFSRSCLMKLLASSLVLLKSSSSKS